MALIPIEYVSGVNSAAIEHRRSGVTASAGTVLRIPSTGTKNTIKANRYTIPFCDNGTNKPVKFSNIEINDGYVRITLAEDISDAVIGLIVFKGV